MSYHKATGTEISIVAPDGITWTEKRSVITKVKNEQIEQTVEHTRSIGDRSITRTTHKRDNEVIQIIETTTMTIEEVKEFNIDWANGWEDVKDVKEDD
jgi:hypothetical protein